jgi:hypothetical protein
MALEGAYLRKLDPCPLRGIRLRFGHLTSPVWRLPITNDQEDVRYEPDNVAVISLKANRIKGKWTADELEAVARWMRAQSSTSGNAGSSSTPSGSTSAM